MIILDMGSGNTCKNNKEIVKKMIDAVVEVDKNHRVYVLKWQLFEDSNDNIPLDFEIFRYAHAYGTSYGFPTTASVFDKKSLDFLLSFRIPFIKIANNEKAKQLITNIPRSYWILSSIKSAFLTRIDIEMSCISKYPAKIEDYEGLNHHAISDHTVGLELYKTFNPQIWEKHFKLPDSTGPDAGPFAITPNELKEIL